MQAQYQFLGPPWARFSTKFMNRVLADGSQIPSNGMAVVFASKSQGEFLLRMRVLEQDLQIA